MRDVRFKVCGITRVEDARVAAEAGASYLGFIFYAKSPRSISLERFLEIRDQLPDLPKVAVLVQPDPSELTQYFEAGFSVTQIHFEQGIDRSLVKEWCEEATPERLWLAPKIKPEDSFDEGLLSYARTILWDAYKKDAFGGTGHRSDWDGFSRLRAEHLGTQWILAGGLSPSNMRKALEESGGDFLDLNSGVESAPGIKDHAKVKAIRDELRAFSGN